MSVTLRFACDGCDAVADSTDRVRWRFDGVTGRPHGFGVRRQEQSVETLAPSGWVACDPYTFATYCPHCWREIMTGKATKL